MGIVTPLQQPVRVYVRLLRVRVWLYCNITGQRLQLQQLSEHVSYNCQRIVGGKAAQRSNVFCDHHGLRAPILLHRFLPRPLTAPLPLPDFRPPLSVFRSAHDSIFVARWCISRFTYLGSDIDSDGYSYPEIHRRLGIAGSIWLNLTTSGVSKDLVSPPSSEYTPLLCSR